MLRGHGEVLRPCGSLRPVPHGEIGPEPARNPGGDLLCDVHGQPQQQTDVHGRVEEEAAKAHQVRAAESSGVLPEPGPQRNRRSGVLPQVRPADHEEAKAHRPTISGPAIHGL